MRSDLVLELADRVTKAGRGSTVMERINDRLLSWASILDEKTRAQAITASSMPFIHPHLALMPDAHLGKGATVGSVIPTRGAVMPAAVGVDIGCGMFAVRTPFTVADMDRDGLGGLHAGIARAIPVSAGGRNQLICDSAETRIKELEGMPGIAQADEAAPKWRYQLGSLGSGNHFIEISTDTQDRVWMFLHSGSRGVGNKLAQRYIAIAREQCERRWIELPDRDLAFLVEGEPEFAAYIEALTWAQRFAWLNREEMMDRVEKALMDFTGRAFDRADEVHCHHNYTVPDFVGRMAIWLSRKGAIDAHAGVRGLIPGSMGAQSHVVVGKGNPASLNSAPHGAGRVHSRTSAKRTFTRADLDERMAGKAWGNSDAFLDEHPDAYKDIGQVMRDADDLVSIEETLTAIVNVKGA